MADDDVRLSELARGIRYARRQAHRLAPADAERYRSWLRNARQLARYCADHRLIVDPVLPTELPSREALRERYGIGRGEAGCLVLAQRYGAIAVFVSSDRLACRAADDLGVTYHTVEALLLDWASRTRPSRQRLEGLVNGLRAAKFGLNAKLLRQLMTTARDEDATTEG